MMELFRGYVKTKNKKCTQKFANGEKLLTLDQAEKLDEYAGIIADGIILVDIDDKEQSEILMDIVEDLQLNCRVYQTNRGKHFYFRNDGVKKNFTGVNLACGLKADIKLGEKNSYAILKFNGQERFIEWEEEGQLDTLPKFLLPIKSDVDFLSLEEGDGRNQTLFNYILTLQNHNINKDDIKETLKIINSYILKDPLKSSELNTIMRDEAFNSADEKRFYDSKGKFRFDEFAKFLVAEHHIIKINGQLHIYNDGIYQVGWNKIESEMIRYISCLTKQKRNEVISYMSILVDKESRCSGAEFIAFRNGIYNIETGDFTDFSPELIITNKIDFNFVPDSYSEIADKTLDKLACNNPEVRELLEQIIGYCFYRRNELRKCFILTGNKSNGKSSYLDMIITLLGHDNTCSLDLSELGDRFKPAQLFGKLANIGDDIGDEFIANPAIFKKVVSGDQINAERKGQDPFDFAPYAKQLFSANSIPRIKDKSGAVLDRLVIVPFDATFSKNDPDYDPYIKYKLREESVMEYLIQIGIKGLKQVLENQAFTTPAKVQDSLKEYAETNNPILMFFQEIEEHELMNKPTKQGYQRYCEFCLSNSFQQLSNIEFSKQVKRQFNCDIVVTTWQGKSARVFRKL